jgi:hypothetical protein
MLSYGSARSRGYLKNDINHFDEIITHFPENVNTFGKFFSTFVIFFASNISPSVDYHIMTILAFLYKISESLLSPK